MWPLQTVILFHMDGVIPLVLFCFHSNLYYPILWLFLCLSFSGCWLWVYFLGEKFLFIVPMLRPTWWHVFLGTLPCYSMLHKRMVLYYFSPHLFFLCLIPSVFSLLSPYMMYLLLLFLFRYNLLPASVMGMLVYGIGIPVWFGTILYRTPSNYHSEVFRKRYSSLVVRYTPDKWYVSLCSLLSSPLFVIVDHKPFRWWNLILLARKFFISFLSTILVTGTTTSSFASIVMRVWRSGVVL